MFKRSNTMASNTKQRLLNVTKIKSVKTHEYAGKIRYISLASTKSTAMKAATKYGQLAGDCCESQYAAHWALHWYASWRGHSSFTCRPVTFLLFF